MFRESKGPVTEREREGGRKCSDGTCSLSLAVPACDAYHNQGFKPKKAYHILFPSCITGEGDGDGAEIYAKRV